MTDAAVSDLDHVQAVLDASLTAAWLRRCGPTGVPGEWMIPGELMEITELGAVEVSVYPTWSIATEHGRIWGGVLGSSDREAAWQWHLNAGWDDLEQSQIDILENLDGCFDERGVRWHVLGDHQQKPPVPEPVVKALALLREWDR